MKLEYCSSCGEKKNNGRIRYCDTCYMESKRVRAHCQIAQKIGLVGDLTLEQWLKTLRHFDWHCAYCQTGPFAILEHFIPLNLGGDTTVSNCVPSCTHCNNRKKGSHPDNVTSVKLEHVRIFLESQY